SLNCTDALPLCIKHARQTHQRRQIISLLQYRCTFSLLCEHARQIGRIVLPRRFVPFALYAGLSSNQSLSFAEQPRKCSVMLGLNVAKLSGARLDVAINQRSFGSVSRSPSSVCPHTWQHPVSRAGNTWAQRGQD